MKYTFKNLLDAEIYDSAMVLFIVGKHSVFNNIAVDEVRERCASTTNRVDKEALTEFGIDSVEESISTSVEFKKFIDVNSIANINGKWFCRESYSILNKQQRDWLMRYIKNPSPNGVLVIVSEDFKDYRPLLNNRILQNSPKCHLLQLGFPNKSILTELVIAEFKERGYIVKHRAADLFVTRLSSSYEDYIKTIDNIAEMFSFLKNHDDPEPEIEYSHMTEALKGVENYVLDDFLGKLVVPLANDKTNNKKIYRILINLMDMYTPKGLVNALNKKIDEMIEFRGLINTGYIPIKVHYVFSRAIKDIGDENPIAKQPEWLFRKNAWLASQTSLTDWVYMKLILSKVSNMSSDEICEKVLYELVTRSVLSESRVNNIIGVDNILSEDLKKLDGVVYKDLDSIDNVEANGEVG